MNITIYQSEFSSRTDYDISAPACDYGVQKKLLSSGEEFQLTSGDRRGVVAKIRSRGSSFRARFDIELSDGGILHFQRESPWRGVFGCQGGPESFHLCEHRGLKFSVFRNGLQIAAFTKNRVQIGKGYRYDIRMNQDANSVLVTCLVLVAGAMNYEDADAASGSEARPFDEAWEPS